MCGDLAAVLGTVLPQLVDISARIHESEHSHSQLMWDSDALRHCHNVAILSVQTPCVDMVTTRTMAARAVIITHADGRPDQQLLLAAVLRSSLNWTTGSLLFVGWYESWRPFVLQTAVLSCSLLELDSCFRVVCSPVCSRLLDVKVIFVSRFSVTYRISVSFFRVILGSEWLRVQLTSKLNSNCSAKWKGTIDNVFIHYAKLLLSEMVLKFVSM